ncbi:MAG: TonB-dependent receptor [Tepidisphaeraceae bacterium]|jgi:outer membrane cobalamin receptor
MLHETAHRSIQIVLLTLSIISTASVVSFAAAPVAPTTRSSTTSASGAKAAALPAPATKVPAVKTSGTAAAPARSAPAENPYVEMSLEQLMQVEVTTNTLTMTERQLVPAAVTHIDRDEIDQQNPRTVNDLLNIYVPNLEISAHPYEMPAVGMRGIIDNTKYLFLVDGREMNEVTHFGALTEQDLYLLGDIQQMDVVRGPGSATYGPGAVEGVVSLQTYNGLTYQGTEVTARGGVLDDFASFEFKHGEKLSEDSGWFIYGGAAQVTGADVTNAPIVQGQYFTAPGNVPVFPGQPMIFPYQREGAEFEGEPQIKVHAEYDSGGFSLWARYTRGGETLDPTDRRYAPYPTGFGSVVPPPETAVGYQQLTIFGGDKIKLSDKLDLDISSSFDATDYERVVPSTTNSNVSAPSDSQQEDKLISKAVLNWQMVPTNQLAVGSEYRYFWLGVPSWFDPGLNGLDSAFTTPQHWNSDMFSMFLEDQWHITKQWTLFLSARADKDRFTEFLYSPRGALAWAPDDKNTFKFIASQSLRTNTEEFMYQQWITNHTLSAPEQMNSLELRYEREQTKNLFFAASIYYDRLDALGWNNVLKEVQLLGPYKTAGIELEASYKTQQDTFTISHGYTKLVAQDFIPNSGEFITAASYGSGYDLNDWSSNVTKLSEHHQFNEQFSVDGNIQVMWGYQGSQDWLNYMNTQPFFGAGTPNSSVPGYTQPFGVTAFLNLGAEYKLGEHSTIRLDAYNVLGWIDPTLNKDDVLGGVWAGAYRVQSPAFALTYKYEF